MSLNRGFVQIYTGNGKGKTTAAIGLAVRAAGYGLKVYLGQFMKGFKYNEHNIFNEINNITYELFGTPNLIHIEDEPDEKNLICARKGFEKAKEILISNDYDIVILDEINLTVFFNLLKIDDLLELIEIKPFNVELILTGRKAPVEIIDKADLVTEMREIKHYYKNGIEARDGIEK